MKLVSEVGAEKYAKSPSFNSRIENSEYIQHVCGLEHVDENMCKTTRLDVREAETVFIVAGDLIEWIIRQPPQSITVNELLDRTLEKTQGDAISALAIIQRLISESAGRQNRNKNGLIASRLKPLFNEAHSDPIGVHYHFWGYFLNALVFPEEKTKLNLISFGYESIFQRDRQDRLADKYGLNMQTLLTESFRNGRCDPYL